MATTAWEAMAVASRCQTAVSFVLLLKQKRGLKDSKGDEDLPVNTGKTISVEQNGRDRNTCLKLPVGNKG